MADETVLTQADIDAMIAANAQEPAAPTEAPAQQQPVYTDSSVVKNKQEPQQSKASRSISTTDAPKGNESQQVANSYPQIESLYAMMADLTKRLNKIEMAMSKFEQMEKIITETVADTSQSPQALRELEEQVEDITEKLSASLGYNIGNIYHCSCCGSDELVAIRVKCTECGDENWLGWWPAKK